MFAVEKVATELKPSLSKNHLLISIAAGVTLVNLQVRNLLLFFYPVCRQRKKLLGLTKSCMVHEV
jgi:hypothetical protein